ncbi:MAG: hypothetical protein ACQKBT_01585 [Puniceicoccales bacterium]
MIHVLVQESRTRSRLSLLLRDLGQSAAFFGSIESLLESYRSGGSKAGPVLFDLQLKDAEGNSCFARLKAELSEKVLIGFEEYDPDTMDRSSERVEGLPFYLLLPSQAERAKSRLKTVLAECRRGPSASRSPGRKSSSRGFRRALNPSAGVRPASRMNWSARSAPVERKPFRYLMAESPASRSFGQKLVESLAFETLLVFSGEPGSEFVLAAREVQYQLHGDEDGLLIISGDEVTTELLHSLEKEAKDLGKQRLCYIEESEDASPDRLRALLQFAENLESLRNPHLRLILGRSEDTGHLTVDSEEILSRLCRKRVWLRLPPLSERPEDVRPIVTGFLSALTYAHPFLTVKGIDAKALDYLEENRSEFSYGRLVQVLRNSIALGQERILSVETFRNFETRNITAEHLVESSADDAFFPQAQECFIA